MRKKKHTIVSTPSSKPALTAFNTEIRGAVACRLKRIERTWNWIARAMSDLGVSSPATVNHWGRGLSKQIGSSIYVAMLETIRKEELAQARARRVRAAKERVA
jgi:hypothetical protein